MNLVESINLLRSLHRESVSVKLDLDESVVFTFKDRSKIENENPTIFELDFERLGNNDISININKINWLFYDEEHFLKNYKRVKGQINSDIGLLFYKGGNFLFYDSNLKKSYINSELVESNHFIQNILFYLEFIEAFKLSDISTYHDDARREFVVISPEKGRLQIGYPLTPPQIPNEYNIVNNLDIFNKRNSSQEFEVFLREQIIDSLSSLDREERFPHLAYNIKHIIESSQRNFETYLNKFSFEELKKNFRKERDEYFISIRDILSKILDKVVSIPISISAAAIAIYNLKNEPLYAYIVITAYIIYSIFTCYLLRLLHFDVWEIKVSLDSDLEILQDSSNIPPEILTNEGSKVYSKINRLQILILVFQILFIALSCIILFVSFQFLSLPIIYNFLLILVVILFHLIVLFCRIKYHVSK